MKTLHDALTDLRAEMQDAVTVTAERHADAESDTEAAYWRGRGDMLAPLLRRISEMVVWYAEAEYPAVYVVYEPEVVTDEDAV